MYAWYAAARKCYAYLADATASAATEDQNGHAGILTGPELAGLKASRWFTRGWAFWELLAPKIVTFLDRD